jgi:hypothetical protein
MPEELVKTKCLAKSWEERDDDAVPATQDVEIEVSFDDDCFYIDGLREGEYLSLPLHALAQAMADGTRPPAGQLAS